MPDVFISYARGDRKRVRPIAKALAAEGFDVWWDQSNSPDGKWTPQLRRALVDSAAILTCWSQEATKSSWVAAEASHANDRKALVSAVLEACKIPAPFNALESADLAKWRGDLDAPIWGAIVRKLRDLVRVRHGEEEPEEPPAPPARRAPAPPAQQAAQVVAPSAFFSQNLGAPLGATARAAPQPAPQPQPPPPAFQPIDLPPPPPAKPPRVVLPPMDPPPPSPRARAPEQQQRPVRPADNAPPARSPPRPIRPVDEAPAPHPAPRPGPRVVQPVDEPAPPPPRPVRQAQRDRKPAPPPPRSYTPVDDVPMRRRGPGFAQFVLIGAVAALIVAGVIWGGERFLSAPSAPKLAQDQEGAAPEPLPTAPTAAETQAAELRPAFDDVRPAEIETAPLAPPAAMRPPPPRPAPATQQPSRPAVTQPSPPAPTTTQPEGRPPQQKLAAAPPRPTAQPPLRPAPTTTQPEGRPSPQKLAAATPPPRSSTTPPASQPPTTTQPESRPQQQKLATAPPRPATPQPTPGPRQPAIVLPQPSLNAGDARATPAASADATRELERCLGRLVRMCPSGSSGRPGFTEDGALSSSERALLNQRSLFAWSDALSSNVANCSRHLNAASQTGQSRPYEPLAAACRGLPTSGPPR